VRIHGLLLRLDGADQFPEVTDGRLGVEAGSGLVQEQYLRVVHQRQGQQQALALAAGELAGIPVHIFLERAEPDQLFDVETAWYRNCGRA